VGALAVSLRNDRSELVRLAELVDRFAADHAL